jgi:hypothetical protein
MAFETIKAEIALILNEIDKAPDNAHEFYLELHAKLNELRALGMPIATDLLRIEQELQEEFSAKQGG